ncbi:protein abscisic acid-insensitive 5 [Phtheirospermum japonicum]|uniref:Protein abscisic acid-insensitive 5 n=1 Tax=Phtheirospermum japonicum TaxID=374723 RepID=A0A830BPE7_9LAMI|nr:protein abscisic acid-insensitive 5 [Phtheirospermum japonicum]
MMYTQNRVQDQPQPQPPVPEDPTLTPSEIHEIFSLLQSLPSGQSTSSSETNRSVYSNEERKRRRMVSNRESARRSRVRKKRHLEDLTKEVNRLKLENRELKNCLCMLTRDCHLVQRDSNRLVSLSIFLHHKLTGLHQILAPTILQRQ